jgi:transposase
VDEHGKVVLRQQVRRAQLLATVAQVPACLIGMEAEGGAHYWSRQFCALGHQVRLISPQFVKPYVKSQKNDRADAEAICEAVQRPSMRFVPSKNLEQQDLQSAHRVRQGLMRERTALINRIRGLLGEYGIALAKRPATVRREVPDLLSDEGSGLTAIGRELIGQLHDHFIELERRIGQAEEVIARLASEHEAVTRLRTIPGIGLLTATTLFGAVGDAKVFCNGRQMAAWLGLVPRQDSSGGNTRLLGMSKRGDKYLRCLLVHGARSIARYAECQKNDEQRWLNAVMHRHGRRRAYIAQANKTARIAWVVMAKGESYRARTMN